MKKIARLAIFALIVFSQSAFACKWAAGYFYQLTDLRGRIVGVNNGDLRHPVRWLRQRVAQGNVRLTLYDYRWPVKDLGELQKVKAVVSDQDGNFAFGKMPGGHYVLVIEAPWGGQDWYDVEFARSAKETVSITIDISPNYPDCTGGHELIIATK